MGGGHTRVALIVPPRLPRLFQGDTERNHVPVLQRFQRIPGQEATGGNLARRVDRTWVQGGPRPPPALTLQARKMLQSFQLISRLGTNDMKAGSYRRGTTQAGRQAGATLWAPWRRQQRREERQAASSAGQGKGTAAPAKPFKTFWGDFLPQHAETLLKAAEVPPAKLRITRDSETRRSNRNY